MTTEGKQIPGQVTIGGETVAGVSFDFGKLSVDSLPEGLTWEQVGSLAMGDEIEVTMRFRLARTPQATASADKVTGDFTKPVEGIYTFAPYLRGFRVTGYLSNEDREAAWRREHGQATA